MIYWLRKFSIHKNDYYGYFSFFCDFAQILRSVTLTIFKKENQESPIHSKTALNRDK